MAEANKPEDKTPSASKAKDMTAAQAAALVKRTVKVQDKDKKETTKQVAVKADEVAGFKDYGDHVIVVTTDGQKLRGDK